MRIKENGHVYEIENLDGPGTQTVRFVKRRNRVGELLPESCREPGILSQDLLRILIDRTLYLYAEKPCDEDTKIIEHLRSALELYESRAARAAIERRAKPEQTPTCPTCRHMLCFGH